MTKPEAIAEIIAVILSIQEESGDETPGLQPDTVVIGGIPGFDSLRGLELAVSMTKYFDITEGENICISDDGTHALTVEQIATGLMAKPQKAHGEDEE